MEKSPVSVRANSTRTVVRRCSSTTPPLNAQKPRAPPGSGAASQIARSLYAEPPSRPISQTVFLAFISGEVLDTFGPTDLRAEAEFVACSGGVGDDVPGVAEAVVPRRARSLGVVCR